MYCKYLSKALNGKLRCKLDKTIININDCGKCLKFNPRVNKAMKKVSKKKKRVSEETYKKVYERDKGICRLKDKNCSYGLEYHHIIYRSEDKSLIDVANNGIMLCVYHHKKVHSNKHYWQPILKDIIKSIEN